MNKYDMSIYSPKFAFVTLLDSYCVPILRVGALLPNNKDYHQVAGMTLSQMYLEVDFLPYTKNPLLLLLLLVLLWLLLLFSFLPHPYHWGPRIFFCGEVSWGGILVDLDRPRKRQLLIWIHRSGALVILLMGREWNDNTVLDGVVYLLL